jgi:hypothetical protein
MAQLLLLLCFPAFFGFSHPGAPRSNKHGFTSRLQRLAVDNCGQYPVMQFVSIFNGDMTQ